MENKPEIADDLTPSEVIEEAMNSEEPAEESSENDVVQEKSVVETDNLTLAQLNDLTGRDFKSREDFEKHYKNLNSLVGDQTRIETEKKAQEAEKANEELKKLQEQVANLTNENETNSFLKGNPEAERAIEHIKLVAREKGVNYETAWNGGTDAQGNQVSGLKELIGDNSPRPSLVTNRLNPNRAKQIKGLAEAAKTGNAAAQEALVAEALGLNNGNR